MIQFQVNGKGKAISVVRDGNVVVSSEADRWLKPTRVSIATTEQNGLYIGNLQYNFGKVDMDLYQEGSENPLAHITTLAGFKNSVEVTKSDKQLFFLNGNSIGNWLVRGNSGLLFRALIPIVYKIEKDGQQVGSFKSKLASGSIEVDEAFFDGLSKEEQVLFLTVFRFCSY
ncbi:hypothetical protein JW887_03920 [Candidatus Dojkabacteria bacterium]|nr:hypothetical protein [Candidatus Dojkabacteria bacterium]